MTTPAFFTFPIRRKRDTILVRHKARQIAAMLQFSVQEQACIAAGTFFIACQALQSGRRSAIEFRIAEHQLLVQARLGTPTTDDAAQRLVRLEKPLPGEPVIAESDMSWILYNSDPGRGLIFEEMVKQNQEVLTLLHDLQVLARQAVPDQPTAA
jgi:hypothetical protein